MKSWNKLTSDLIFVGQKLTIKQSATGNTNNNNSNSNTGSQASNTYTIKAGDTLSKIAAKYNTTVANLKSWNKLTSDLIFVGQKLAIKQTANQNNHSTQHKTHTVKSGDTLYAIALRYQTSVSKIKSLNNKKSDIIYVGEMLNVK